MTRRAFMRNLWKQELEDNYDSKSLRTIYGQNRPDRNRKYRRKQRPYPFRKFVSDMGIARGMAVRN